MEIIKGRQPHRRLRRSGAALVLLHIIWRDPQAVMRAVARACQVEGEMDTLVAEDAEDD